MPRFVIARKRAGRDASLERGLGVGGLMSALGNLAYAPVPAPESGEGSLPAIVVEADAGFEVLAAEALPPDLIVEPEFLYWPDGIPPADFLPASRGVLSHGAVLPFTMSATGGGAPLAHARVELHLRYRGAPHTVEGWTDAQGDAVLHPPAGYRPAALVVIPAGGFWPMVVRGEGIRRPVECPPLPSDGPLGWWHRKVGVAALDAGAGQGIRIGVIDTGGGPHPNLAHATFVGAFLNGGMLPPPATAADVGAHGSHVAATIGSRPLAQGDYAGIAPGCELFVARVFGNAESGATNADIANAITVLSRDHGVHVINLSLGGSDPSQIIHAAIVDAAEIGTLCVCAAGNDGLAVNYPARFPEAVAVSALGLAGWAPPGSVSATRLPEDGRMHGEDDLFAANFTSRGSEVAATAPGVGILAAVPSHHGEPPMHAAMDGTSMACPVVCGCLAILLSQDGTYLAMARERARTDAARSLLMSLLRNVGLAPTLQGGGMPWVHTVAPAVI